MIQVSNLSKSYGEKRAIQNLNFTLEKGEVVGLLGLNGAGKTTTIRILTGYLIPTAGDAKINGKSIFDEPLEAKKKIGYLPESPPLYEEMNVRDYLIFVARIKAVPQEIFLQEIERVLSKTGITEVQDHVIGQLSLGFRKRVGIAQALVGNPDVIIMDEPISGLDPKQIIEIRNLIKDLAGEHTVLISSHILAEIYKTCDKFLFIQDGRLKKTYSLLELEDEMEKLSGLEITLSGKSKEDIESYLKSNLDSESKIEFQEEDRNGCTFLINVMNEKDFKKKIFSSLDSQ
ncbi:MAG: ABC transporter ATP-binding protein, partial [Leptospira sp.]|nr:ABC transporter ATP-binding protein [Leptospira sp.]